MAIARKFQRQLFCAFVILCMIVYTVHSHVTLTFPPARKYAFDFLDNIRTPRPCGVPKGLGDITNLRAGDTITVTWHIAYPHKGGYRLSLLDEKENVIHQFQTRYVESPNPTKQHQEITLPSAPCMNCTLQIIRQAAEWGSNCDNGQYLFWSCADINILASNTGGVDWCRGHPYVDGRCICRAPYSGATCQFKDECQYDSDCNNGKCLNIQSTYFPKKQCYCNAGWFGSTCNKRSAVYSPNIDYSLYINNTLSPEYMLYHRIIQDEIEVIMRVKTKTWVGLGWRPSDFKSGCQYFPRLSGVVPRPEPEPEGSTSEPEPERSTSEPEPEKSTSEPEPEKSTSEPEPEKSTSEPEPEKSTSEPEPEKSTSEPEPEKSTSEPEPEPHYCGGSVSGSKSGEWFNMTWAYDDVSDVVTFTINAPADGTHWVGIGFSKNSYMAGSDVYTGWLDDNGIVYMQDRYAFQRAEPPMDQSQDIFNVTGSRVNGRTTLEFSRKRNTGDQLDISFVDNCVIPLFAWGGGVVDNTNMRISYHRIRYNQAQEICIKPCPKPEPEPESSTSEPEPERSTSEPEPERSTSEPEPERSTSEPEPEKSTSEPEPEKSTSEPEPERSTSEPEPEKSTSEPEPEGSTSEPEPEGEGEPGSCGAPPQGINDTTGARPHPMDCVDMVIGTAKGQLSRIGDYYTRDRSTPLTDEMFGGRDDLTAAYGFEDDDGYTTIMFRRKITATERSDHSILNEYMHVIWARGQEDGKYSHNPRSGIDDPNLRPSDPLYYKEDELKYHGHVGQRGVKRINFLDVPTGPVVGECKQTWRNPSDDSHEVTWEYNAETDNVHFTLKARLLTRQWIGVGISNNAFMAETDTIVAWINSDNTVTVVDGWATTRSLPTEDAQQDDIKGIEGSVSNGITTISFYRARNTGNTDDIAFNGNDCVHLIYPKGGQYTAGPNPLRLYSRHDSTPIVSTNKFCIPCPSFTMSTAKPSEKFWVPIVFKLLGIPWSSVYEDVKSREYINLKEDLQLALKLKFNRVTGMITVIITGFSPGSVNVNAVVEIEGNDKTRSKNDVSNVLTDFVETGRLEGYTVDANPGSFSVGDPVAVRSITEAPPVPDIELLPETVWFIIALSAAGLLLVVILGICNCARIKRQNKKNKYLDEEHRELKLNGNGYNDNGSSSSSNGHKKATPMNYDEWRNQNNQSNGIRTSNVYTNPSYVSENQAYQPPSYYHGYEIHTYVDKN